MDVPIPDIQTTIDGWKTTYADAWAFLLSCQQKVTDPGYIETPWGRRRYFPRVDDQMLIMAHQREAMNCPIQSTVADTMRMACSRVLDERNRRMMRSKISIQIHDALMSVTPIEETEEMIEVYKQQMGGVPIPMPTGTPLILDVDIDIYTRWGEKLK